MFSPKFSYVTLGLLILGAASGCSDRPARIAVPQFEPRTIARAALSELDSDGDAQLSSSEIQQSPGLNSSMSVFDRNGDGALSDEELSSEFQNWLDEKTGLISIRCEVSYKGKPLTGATVRLVPEPFLKDVVPEASGETDAMGMTQLGCAAEHLPEALKSMRALKPGVYRVEVTHPQVSLPAKYNSRTVLGRSVSLRNSHSLFLKL